MIDVRLKKQKFRDHEMKTPIRRFRLDSIAVLQSIRSCYHKQQVLAANQVADILEKLMGGINITLDTGTRKTSVRELNRNECLSGPPG